MPSDDETDSLFDSDTDSSALEKNNNAHELEAVDPVASTVAAEIRGLYLFPDLLPRRLHDEVLQRVAECAYFSLDNDTTQQDGYQRGKRNQVMLFGRSQSASIVQTTEPSPAFSSGLPQWAEDLISNLEQLLDASLLPDDLRQLLFPQSQQLSRQLILNLYTQGEGLFPHVDLVNRFADGIILCSFGPSSTGTVMDFYHTDQPAQHLYLPSCSVLVLSGEARYDWKHGITARSTDRIQHPDGSITEQNRSLRLSVTIRAMLPGADIVGA